jgi:hypothetical protein
VPRRDARYLRRNALVVLGNVADPADPRVRAAVERYLGADDLLRAHAVWAARRLGYHELVRAHVNDPSPQVRAECTRAGVISRVPADRRDP